VLSLEVGVGVGVGVISGGRYYLWRWVLSLEMGIISGSYRTAVSGRKRREEQRRAELKLCTDA